MNKMEAVVVILNYNDAENCVRVANAALETGYIQKAVIVDNCSPDGSFEKLKKINDENIIVLQSEKNGGYAYGHNVGINYAIDNFEMQYIFTINSDIIFEKDIVFECINYLKLHSECGVVSGVMYNEKGEYAGGGWYFPSYADTLKECFWMHRKKTKTHKVYRDNETFVDAVRGSFLCFNATALKEVGGFDENTFLYYEENIICTKLKNKGYTVVSLNNVSYIHNHPKVKKQKINIENGLKSMYYYMVKYRKINIFEKILLSVCINYGILEQKLIDRIKVLGRKDEYK